VPFAERHLRFLRFIYWPPYRIAIFRWLGRDAPGKYRRTQPGSEQTAKNEEFNR
jgi:hypothetical protein